MEFALPEVGKRAKLSTAVAAREIAKLIEIGIVRKIDGEGKNAQERKVRTRYAFNERFRHANSLSTFIHEISPERFDEVEKSLKGVGRLTAIVLSGIFIGDVRRPLDVLLVSDTINERRLETVMKSFEAGYGREIRYAVFSTPEFRYRLTIQDKLLRNTLDYPHRVLLNKGNLL
jgi:hypothetical protein